MDGRNIVLFDGVCNLCNSSVRFLLRIDKKNMLYFAHLQSEFSESLLDNIDTGNTTDSVAFVTKGNVYYKSEAVINILYVIGYPWRVMCIFKLFPKMFLDFLYDFIARYRYRWFGRRQKCIIPDDELLERFLP